MENEKRLDLIDRKKLFNDLADYWGIPRDWDGRMLQTCEDALSMIENAPTVDAVEVVHGKWKRSAFFGKQNKRTWEYFCSECKTLGSPQWKCCPVCTALMDGGNDDAN